MGSIYYKAILVVASVLLTITFSAPTHDGRKSDPAESDNKGSYSYSYSVNSPSNGDIKTHSETRNDEIVTGEYSFVQPDGCIRHVRYTAGVDGFIPEIHYEGNCNSNNFVVSSEETSSIVTHFMAPVTAIKTESHQSHAVPSHSHTYKLPLATFKLPSESYESASNTKKPHLEDHKAHSNAQISESSGSHAHETHSEITTGFSPSIHNDYEYPAHSGPSVVLALSGSFKPDSSHSKPPGADRSPPASISAEVTTTSSEVSGLVHNAAETHDHWPAVSGTENHPSVEKDVPLKDYAHVHSTFTVPDSNHHAVTNTNSHASKLPHKY